MKPITFKQVLDPDGSLHHIELHQDGRYIEMTLSAMGTHNNGFRWIEVKKTVDRLADKAMADVLKDIEDNNKSLKGE